MANGTNTPNARQLITAVRLRPNLNAMTTPSTVVVTKLKAMSTTSIRKGKLPH